MPVVQNPQREAVLFRPSPNLGLQVRRPVHAALATPTFVFVGHQLGRRLGLAVATRFRLAHCISLLCGPRVTRQNSAAAGRNRLQTERGIGSVNAPESGRGLPHSKPLPRRPGPLECPPGRGVRQSSGAFVLKRVLNPRNRYPGHRVSGESIPRRSLSQTNACQTNVGQTNVGQTNK